MKIYQVHECGGEWGDIFDNIVKSFLSKKKAEDYKKECETEYEINLRNSKICDQCPLCSREEEEVYSFEELANYCQRVATDDIIFKDKIIGGCSKYVYMWDDYYYDITEVEVEE